MKKVRRSELKPGKVFDTDIIFGSESHGSIETKTIENFDFGRKINVKIGYGTSQLSGIIAKRVTVEPVSEAMRFFKSCFGKQNTEETSCHFYNCDIEEIILVNVDNVTVQGSPSPFSLKTTNAKLITIKDNPELKAIETINPHKLVHITSENNPELVLTPAQQVAKDQREARDRKRELAYKL